MDDDESRSNNLIREKRAMIGYAADVNFYKEKIRQSLFRICGSDANIQIPPWYETSIDGIFAELYGFAGLDSWIYDRQEEYIASSSAKIIGDRIYCLINGASKLQPQRINKERREKLKRTLLLATPNERLEYGFHEVYLLNGIRITIYSGSRTKPDQDVIVMRKYLTSCPTFEELYELGTIPEEGISFFKLLVETGYNVIFSGQVRSGKTTFMRSWQSYEDTSLEGLAISTDPETPWHVLMPTAPIMQIVADGKALEDITKPILRGDNDYVLLEEMRDGIAFRIAVEITSTGTKRSKATIHAGTPFNIPYKMASKIVERYGGRIESIERQIYNNFDLIVQLAQEHHDKGKKRMTEIYFVEVDKNGEGRMTPICEYSHNEQSWKWHYRDMCNDEVNVMLKRICDNCKERDMKQNGH